MLSASKTQIVQLFVALCLIVTFGKYKICYIQFIFKREIV